MDVPDMRDDEDVRSWLWLRFGVDHPRDIAAFRHVVREVARKVADEAYEVGFEDGYRGDAPLKVTRDDVVTNALDAILGPERKEG